MKNRNKSGTDQGRKHLLNLNPGNITIWVLFVGGLCLLLISSSLSAGATTDTAEFDVTTDGAVDTPKQEFEFEGNQLTVSSFAEVSPDENIIVNVTSPENKGINVQLRDSENDIIATKFPGSGYSTVSFNTTELKTELERTQGRVAGTYTVVLESDSSIEAVLPVVISGYNLTVQHVSSTEINSQANISVELSFTELEANPKSVEVTAFTDDQVITTSAQRQNNTYEATLSFDNVGLGEYNVYAAALGDNETATGDPIALAVGSGRSISVRPNLGYYASSDDTIQTSGLSDAVGDWVTGRVDTSLLQDIVEAWVSGNTVAE